MRRPCDDCDALSVISVKREGGGVAHLCLRHVSPGAKLTQRQRLRGRRKAEGLA